MKGLQDNSGKYDHNRKLEDFSAAFLANLAREYAQAYLAMDDFWNGAVRQRVGDKEALDCELVVWRRVARYVLPRIAKLSNIQLPVKDVVEAIKVWQIGPDSAAPDAHKMSYDIKDLNHAIGTITYCVALERYEKDSPQVLETLCRVLMVEAVEQQCRTLHPRMKVTPLKLPPRTDYTDCCCQWEFRLDR